MHLDPEQEELLYTLDEAERNKREPFLSLQVDEQINLIIRHKGLLGNQIQAYPGDFGVLLRANLISANYLSAAVCEFDMLPTGFAYYKKMKEQRAVPVANVEGEIRRYLDGERFQKKYPEAHHKLKNAEELLWESDSQRQLTTIGHLCREALQEFATILVEENEPHNVDADKAHTVSRLRAVISCCREKLGEAKTQHLNALVAYWGTVSDLVQRQEHGGQKDGEPLVWEDGSRVVFQTVSVMYEIDRTLGK
jgi:hypothetical protein